VELLEQKESVVNRVATRSSTRNQPDSNSRVRRTRSRKKLESSSSDSDRNEVAPEPTRTVVHFEKGIEENQLPIDISSEVGRTIADSNPRIVPSVVYCDVTERNPVAMSRHRHNVASRHYDGSRRCCYSGVN
jgi:hypothetical protein